MDFLHFAEFVVFSAEFVKNPQQKFVEQSGKHPAELLDINNSAGGVCITAQHKLDKSSFSAGIENAVLAAVKRTKELGKQNKGD